MNHSNHILVLPYPYQGHVIPSLALCHQLVEHGFSVTFVNTEFSHERIINSISNKHEDHMVEGIKMLSVPDGLTPDKNFNDVADIANALKSTVPAYLEEVIRKENEKFQNRIKWMIIDGNMAWSIPVAKKLGLKVIAFWPAAATTLAMIMSVPKLIQDGVIHDDGQPVRPNEMFQLGTGMPPILISQLPWYFGLGSEAQKKVFHYLFEIIEPLELVELIICNSSHELESTTFDLFPRILPIGPLMADKSCNKPIGHFWKEDTSCLKWLDKQSKNSVVYVAFGSVTVFGKCQFEEIALGLELCNVPFLWVVRPDLTSQMDNVMLNDYKSRIEGRGLLVEWCPQQQVLAHNAIACFVSHCGWNSTLEGVMNGVPFICWPYFVDQFLNQNFICNVWRTGLEMSHDNGIISKEQIQEKIKELLSDKEMRARATNLMEAANRSIAEGGSSFENFKRIVGIMKG